jgi:hypothetical protein
VPWENIGHATRIVQHLLSGVAPQHESLTPPFLFTALLVGVGCIFEIVLRRARIVPPSVTVWKARRLVRRLIYSALAVLTGLIWLLNVRPLWEWYARTDVSASPALTTIIVIAVTAWAGSLVSFTITRRVTPRRAFGLRLLTSSIALGVVAMVLEGALLHSVLMMMSAFSASLGLVQLKIRDYASKYTMTIQLSHDKSPPATKPYSLGESTAVAPDTRIALEDSVLAFVHGGVFWLIIALCSQLRLCCQTPSPLI